MLQNHPVDSYDKKLNFWEEFPVYKTHKIFGQFFRLNKKEDHLKESSLFMWLLTMCYDRKSPMFAQPEIDKWEVTSEDLFENALFMQTFIGDPYTCANLSLNKQTDVRTLISEFEQSIDTPLGLSLRRLEAKLADRTDFITSTKYTMDSYKNVKGKNILEKGTADQLDRMFAATDKINGIIQAAMNALRSSEVGGVTKGDQKESLSDGDKGF
ncbi:hypothetical protein LCGC14_1347970 [marine sediment metagenome]|uniref:Uncharacterized protein n=1 Tax=marine sediment metagenome TaxID=412755 RepID=A0A0F9NE13_9ZZZZ|nr:hypothetical protein [Bacteroides sp.]